MSEQGYLPPQVRRYLEESARHGLDCQVMYSPNQITVLWADQRVRATSRFKYRKRAGWYNHHGTLTIDGLVCEVAKSFEELKFIIGDPDSHLKVQQLRETFPNGFTYCDNPPVTDRVFEADDLAVPQYVALQWAKVCRLTAKSAPQATVTIEHPGDDLWQVRIRNLNGPDNDMVVQIKPHHETWKTERVVLTILPNPGDLALDLGKRIEEAFGHLAGSPMPSGGFGPAAGHTQAPRGKNDQLVVKSNTVIRT